jgi:ferritin-like metal-binding protein YciE
MKKRIKEMFNECPEQWTYEDLQTVLQDIEEGGENTKETIKEVLKEIEEQVEQCATCGQMIEPERNSFILEFGPNEIRKEAHFCAIDCLQYFVKHIKDLKERRKEF